jgi:hypothetical protein
LSDDNPFIVSDLVALRKSNEVDEMIMEVDKGVEGKTAELDMVSILKSLGSVILLILCIYGV